MWTVARRKLSSLKSKARSGERRPRIALGRGMSQCPAMAGTLGGPRPPARIADVAREARVSITTVSHVLSGKRPVSARSREAVLAAAHRLNYVPTVAARGLATGRTMALGLQFPLEGEQLLLNPYFPSLLEGLSAAAVQAGYTFVLLPAHRTSGFPLDAVLGTQRLDAAILVDPQHPNELIPVLREYGVPIVTLGRYMGRHPTFAIDNDHADAMGRAVDHLLEAGYRQPALVSVSGMRVSYVTDIEAGYRRAAAARGFAPLLTRGDISEQAGYDAGIRLLTRRRPPDAILAGTDRQAVGVLAAASELGLRVPDDVGIVGEGNTPLAHNARPPLTSLDARPEELGRAAVDLIGRILDSPSTTPPQTVVVPAVLVARESTMRRQDPSGRG